MVQSLNSFEIVLALIVGVLSVARTARLITHDTFPPAEWLREQWDNWTTTGSQSKAQWNELLHCPFCLAPYLAAGMAGWAWVSDLHWTWWVINGIWGLSYLSAIVVAYDQPE